MTESARLLGLSARWGQGTQFLLILLTLLALPLATVAQEQPPTPVEYRPAQVTIIAEFAAGELLPADCAVLRDSVRQTLRRLIGRRWDVTFQTEAAFLAGRRLADLTVAEVPIERLAREDSQSSRPPPVAEAPDKMFFVFVTPNDARFGFRIDVREWDRVSDSLGPIATREAASRRALPKAFVAALFVAYRPVAQVVRKDEMNHLIFRGAALTAGVDSPLAPAQGTFFRPLLNRRDTSGALAQVSDIPYTYLELTALEDEQGEIKVHSAFRSPLGPFRGLMTAWAIAISPLAAETEITLLRETDGVPLAGRRIEIRPEPPTPGEEPTEPLKTLLTDRSGRVTVSRNPEYPLLWLTIKSGRARLMRLPLVPGTPSQLELEFGNDQRRLATEGRLAILTGEIIETVAKRATLLAKARAQARDAQFQQARAALKQAAKLPSAQSFRGRLATIATAPALAAEQAGHPTSAARIRALADQLGELIDRYLDTKPVAAMRREIDGLEQAVEGK